MKAHQRKWKLDICLCLPPDRTWYKVNDPKVDDSRNLGEGKVRSTSRGLSPAWLCWSSTHLVQCGANETYWTWTQVWVQARMPEYSLNWTTGSSAIQGGQRRQWKLWISTCLHSFKHWTCVTSCSCRTVGENHTKGDDQ